MDGKWGGGWDKGGWDKGGWDKGGWDKGGWDKGGWGKGGWEMGGWEMGGKGKGGWGKGDMWGDKGKGKGMMGGKGMMKGKGKDAGDGKFQKEEKPPDPSKNTFQGQVVRQSADGNSGFIACEDTFQIYQKDVYMWKTYFYQCDLGDWVSFQIHVSDKGLPQVLGSKCGVRVIRFLKFMLLF